MHPREIIIEGPVVSELRWSCGKALDSSDIIVALTHVESTPFATDGWLLTDPVRSRSCKCWCRRGGHMLDALKANDSAKE